MYVCKVKHNILTEVYTENQSWLCCTVVLQTPIVVIFQYNRIIKWLNFGPLVMNLSNVPIMCITMSTEVCNNGLLIPIPMSQFPFLVLLIFLLIPMEFSKEIPVSSMKIPTSCNQLWKWGKRSAGIVPCPLPFPFSFPAFSSDRQHLSYDGCLEVRGEIIRTVLCCIVY